MCSLCLEHAQLIHRLERSNGPSEANKVFVEKLLEQDNAAWFSEFVSALQNAGECFSCLTRTHTRCTHVTV